MQDACSTHLAIWPSTVQLDSSPSNPGSHVQRRNANIVVILKDRLGTSHRTVDRVHPPRHCQKRLAYRFYLRIAAETKLAAKSIHDGWRQTTARLCIPTESIMSWKRAIPTNPLERHVFNQFKTSAFKTSLPLFLGKEC